MPFANNIKVAISNIIKLFFIVVNIIKEVIHNNIVVVVVVSNIIKEVLPDNNGMMVLSRVEEVVLSSIIVEVVNKFKMISHKIMVHLNKFYSNQYIP